jgi:polygalacturonase
MKISCALLLLGMAGLAHSQDLRPVSEPHLPPACAVLIANRTGPEAGTADDGERIQGALNRCAAGQSVRLAGSNQNQAFLSGPLDLPAGVTLVVEGGATLYASLDPKAYDRGRGSCGKTDAVGHGCRPFIRVEGGSHGGIMGDGIIDGQGGEQVEGRTESWWQIARRAQKEKSEHNVPRLIEVSGAQEFTLYRITLRNSPNFHVTLNNVDGFTAWGVRIDTPATARNTDGIDPISSRNITITHSFIRTGDDNVAIKANKSGPTEHVSVIDNHFYSGHGMSIGSETLGVRHVLVQRLSMDGTTSGLRIKSDVSRGGRVEDIRYRDICLREVRAPIDIDTHYTPGARGELIPVYEGLQFEQVRILNPGRIIVLGHDAQRPVRASFKDLRIDGSPSLQIEHAELTPAEPFSQAAAAGAPSCEQRFPSFPQPAPVDPRPQLSAEQARAYAYAEVLKYAGEPGREAADPWDPLADPLARATPRHADYVVDPAADEDGSTVFHSVQAAVSRAVGDARAGNTARRRFIRVKPGVYREVVYVPKSLAPITLYGDSEDAAATVITANLDAAVTGTAFATQYAAEFANADPDVQAMAASVGARATLSTFASATVWVRNSGFQARNITFENAYRRPLPGQAPCVEDCRAAPTAATAPVQHQAVALMLDGADRSQFENVRLLGLQDTLYLKTQDGGRTARSFFDHAYIEGDVDFIFGDATAFFSQSEIRSLGSRANSYVGAPDTNIRSRYGLVFDHCNFTNDGSPQALAGRYNLVRQWFHNQRCTPFGAMAVPGYACTVGEQDRYDPQDPSHGTISRAVLETVGKMVVLHSRIGRHINKSNPWADWNQSGKLSYRPVQFDSDGYWAHLIEAGIDPVEQLGYTARPAPALVFLGEFENSLE